MISSPLLPHMLGYTNGRWVGARSGRTTQVINPANGQPLATVPEMDAEEAQEAVECAAAAMRETPSVAARRQWLATAAEALGRERQELARIITLENGKPLRESLAEIEYAAGFFRFFAGQLDHLGPREIPETIRGCRWTVHHRPAGVAGLITPWNFPLAMLAKKVSAAVGAGCAVVIKPAPNTPLSAMALCAILSGLGLPPGWVNLVPGVAAPIGQVFCSHPAVRLISFTGSTAVGKLLAEQSAPHLKRLALELGGNAPFIVLEDSDPAAAADALMANKFRATGQTCICANRVYVQQRLARRFIAEVTDRVKRLKVGDGMDPATDVGPLINRAGFDKVAAHVADAIARGARRLVGHDPARPAQEWGAFYPPTVLDGLTSEMLLSRQETFGPVVAIGQFEDEREVVDLGNSTAYGLAGYVFSGDPARAQRLAPLLQFGHLAINSSTGPTPEAPFGGMKCSGVGREGGVEGLLEYCEVQTVARA